MGKFTLIQFAAIIIIIPLIITPSFADWDVGAKYAGEFLTLGADARASAMGESGAAFNGSPAAAYWNPASLADIEGGAALLMHANRFGGVVKYDFLSAAQRFSEREVFGITVLRLGVDDIPITSLENPNSPISPENIVRVDKWVNDSEMAIIGGYAVEFRENLSLGLNGKIISKKVGDNYALGLGFDIGGRYRYSRNLYLGARISDATTTFLGWDTGHKELILPSLAIGAAVPLRLDRLDADLNLALDLVFRGENRGEADQFDYGRFSGEAHLGLEYVIMRTVSLRAGMDRDYFTAGAGVRIGPVTADYAYQSHEGLGESHRVSAGFYWRGNPFSKDR